MELHTAGTWSQTEKIFQSATDDEDTFFGRVAIYNKTCIIGTYVYQLQSGTQNWQNTQHIVPSENNDYLGVSRSSYIFAGMEPSSAPTRSPSTSPTGIPTEAPTKTPSAAPSQIPSITPTQPPTQAPLWSPTVAPTISPTQAPTQAPTNTLCDATIQTYDTYILCNFLDSVEVKPNNVNDSTLRSLNYCNDDTMNKYFQCSNIPDLNTSITHIYLNNSGIVVSFADNYNQTFWLFKLIKKGVLISLDLSNNEMNSAIIDWSGFRFLQILSLANSSISGTIDFWQLSSSSLDNTTSNLIKIDLSNNNFDQQTIEWDAFEYMVHLETFDISYNQFEGNIDINYFAHCPNLKYFNVAYNLHRAGSCILHKRHEWIHDLMSRMC